MTTKRDRSRIVARAPGRLRLWHDGDTYRMVGGEWGEHTLRERCFNERVAAHWFGYLSNNGVKATAEHYPQVQP